jgi:hypothetical protein
MPNQRRRIQWMMAQKMQEEASEKERGEHFNTMQSVIPTRQEWRVKEKTDIPAPTISDDDMDLLDDDESPLIKDGSPLPTGMDMNIVFTLPTEFRGAKEEVAQMCLGPKEAIFEKPEASSQHLKHCTQGSYRWENDLQDARRWFCCCQLDVILHLQEAWKGG